MKRYIILLSAVAMAFAATAHTPIESILESIAGNNNSIKAVDREVEAAQTELSAANALENPTFEFEYMWGEKQIPGGNKYAFALMQGFDFPTLYAQRGKHIAARKRLGGYQRDFARQSVLLEARELCIKIVYLNKQIKIVKERVNIAQSLVQLYDKRLAAGDANRIEVNKVEIEYLSQSSRLKMLIGERETTVALLTAYNGGTAFTLDWETLTQYPSLAVPASLDAVIAEWQQADAGLKVSDGQLQVAESYTSVSKQGWIPKFELGYKQAYEVGDMFYGLAVGVSLPLFKTNNEVKTAKARALSLSFQADETKARITAEATRRYQELTALQMALDEYSRLSVQENRLLLLKALENGQISLLEYMSDIAQLNEAEENRLMLEYQYFTTLSQLNRGNL